MGADGLGKLGHFMSLVSIAVLLAGGGISHGVIKYVAEFKESHFKMYKLFSTSIFYALGFCLVAFVFLLVFSEKISTLIFGRREDFWIVIVLAFAQFVFAFNILFSGFFNGLGKLKVNASVQVISNILVLPIIWWLISAWGVSGAAMAMVSLFTMPALISLFFLRRMSIFRMVKWQKFDITLGRNFSRFGLMLLVSALMFPVVEIIIRESLITQVGYAQAEFGKGVSSSRARILVFSAFF